MDEERINMSIRKFLKEVGVTSQRHIEALVRATDAGGGGKVTLKMVLTAEGTDLNHVVETEIDVS